MLPHHVSKISVWWQECHLENKAWQRHGAAEECVGGEKPNVSKMSFFVYHPVGEEASVPSGPPGRANAAALRRRRHWEPTAWARQVRAARPQGSVPRSSPNEVCTLARRGSLRRSNPFSTPWQGEEPPAPMSRFVRGSRSHYRVADLTLLFGLQGALRAGNLFPSPGPQATFSTLY